MADLVYLTLLFVGGLFPEVLRNSSYSISLPLLLKILLALPPSYPTSSLACLLVHPFIHPSIYNITIHLFRLRTHLSFSIPNDHL